MKGTVHWVNKPENKNDNWDSSTNRAELLHVAKTACCLIFLFVFTALYI